MPDEQQVAMLRRSVSEWNNWREANPSGHPNLAGADLAGADLRRADLTGANLMGANLRRANLRRANLTEANLRRANLTEADLTMAILRRANLTGADLTEVNLKGASFVGTILVGAFTKAGLREAISTADWATRAKLVKRDARRGRLELVLAADITPQEIADIIGALNVLHVADSGAALADPVIRIGLPDEVPSAIPLRN